jgi:hypothetical protein
MFAVIAQINWLAVALAFVVSSAFAAFYFAVVIAKPYVVALGREGAPKPQGSIVSGLGPVVCVLVTTVTSAVLLRALAVTSIGDALVFGVIVGVGYLTAMTFQIAINPNFPRPLYYGLINAPFFIVSSLATSAILVALR